MIQLSAGTARVQARAGTGGTRLFENDGMHMLDAKRTPRSGDPKREVAGMLKFLSLVLLVSCTLSAQEVKRLGAISPGDSLMIRLENPLALARVDEAISIPAKPLFQKINHRGTGSLIVLDQGKEIASQIDDTNRDGSPDLLTFVLDFLPKEEKTIVIKFVDLSKRHPTFTKRTQADLSIKKDFDFVDGKYMKGRFVDIDSVRVPAQHVDHDALFRHEGPGWESDKVGYRFYLDARNRTDIFGKKMPDVILHTVADNNESYESMMSWGMDNFKVGTSLGIGSIAMEDGKKVVTVSETDSIFCVIAANGPVRSDVQATYCGWKVGGKKYHLRSSYSITAGSRLTNCQESIFPAPSNLCTGLAKHENTSLLEPRGRDKRGWQYLGVYGNQSRSGDSMGIAVFYRGADRIERREDEVSYLVTLRPQGGILQYYFAAAWQQEPNGIQSLEEFRAYLESIVAKLDHPVRVQY